MNRLYFILGLVLSVSFLHSCDETPVAEPEKVETAQADSTLKADQYLELASSAYEGGDIVKSLEYANLALYKDSSRVDVFLFISHLFYELNNIEPAMDMLRQGLKVAPTNEDLLLNLGKYLMFKGDHQRSMNRLNELLKLNIGHSEAYFYKSFNYLEVGDTTSAIKNLTASIELDPSNIDGWVQLGNIHSELKDPIALRYYEGALRLDSTYQDAQYGKAMYLQNLGKERDAIAIYTAMISKDPQNESAIYNLGYVYFQLDSLNLAVKNFKLATKVAPTYSKAYYMVGLCSETQGNLEEAKAWYNQTLNFDPDFELASKGIDRIEQSK